MWLHIHYQYLVDVHKQLENAVQKVQVSIYRYLMGSLFDTSRWGDLLHDLDNAKIKGISSPRIF